MSLLQHPLDRFDGVSPSLLRGFAEPVELVGCVNTLALEVFLQDGYVAAELVHARVLCIRQALADFFYRDGWLDGFRWSARPRSVDKVQVSYRDAKALKVGSFDMEAYLAAVGADLVDSPDRRSRADGDLFAEVGDARLIGWLRCELSGFRHGLVVTLTWRSEALDLLGCVAAGKCDFLVRAEDRDQVIGDRGLDEASEGFSELAVIGLVPVDGAVAGCGNEFDVLHVALVRAFAEKMRARRDAVDVGHREIVEIGRAA